MPPRCGLKGSDASAEVAAGMFARESDVRAAISAFAKLTDAETNAGLARLRADLDSGAWHERHDDLLGRDALDLGYGLVVAST